MSDTLYFILLAVIFITSAQDSPPFFDYDTFFVDPNYIVNREYPNTTWEAQKSIARWAEDLVQYGPWSAYIIFIQLFTTNQIIYQVL